MKYYNVESILSRGMTFNTIYSGRGVGKTFSSLEMVTTKRIPHIYMRRIQKEIDLSCNENINPYKSVNTKTGMDVRIKKKNGIPLIINEDTVLGYAVSLNTFGSLRGADFSEIEYIIFDEFIRKPGEKKIKDEGFVFSDFYETVARNREASGKSPPIVLFLTNAVSMYSEIMDFFGLTSIIENMVLNRRRRWKDNEKSFAVEIIYENEVSEAKKDSALYKALGEDSEYTKFSLNNTFTGDSLYNVKRMPLNEYRPVFSYEDIFFYSHKSTNLFYACHTKGDCPSYNKDTYLLFRRNHWIILREVMISGKIFFSDYHTKKSVESLIWET